MSIPLQIGEFNDYVAYNSAFHKQRKLAAIAFRKTQIETKVKKMIVGKVRISESWLVISAQQDLEQAAEHYGRRL